MRIEVDIVSYVARSVVLPVSSIHKKHPISYSVRKPSEAGFMSCASVVINKESSSEERESGNFTFKSRIADLNTSGPGAKV